MLNMQGEYRIDWCDYSWNPISGCLHNCEYCYLKRTNMSMTPKFHPYKLNDLDELKGSSKIFVGSSGDCFGDWVPNSWINSVLDIIRKHPEHIFQFLTKNPKRYLERDWTEYKNIWIGITIDTQDRVASLEYLKQTKASLKFVSFEPLLQDLDIDLTGIDWIIIGANSNRGAEKPSKEWADKLIRQARELHIPIWIKNNYEYPERIKELPETRG
jgi:protein gp37